MVMHTPVKSGQAAIGEPQVDPADQGGYFMEPEAGPSHESHIEEPPASPPGPPEKIVYPSQRCAAVTRVVNQVMGLLPNLTENEDLVSDLLEKLKTKIIVFFEICEDELLKNVDAESKKDFEDWVNEKKIQMTTFVKGFTGALENHRLANLGDSASVTSNSSSVREKLEEKRAHLLTEKKYFQESLKLEQQQIQLNKALKELELRKKEEECSRLEQALSSSDVGCRKTPKHPFESSSDAGYRKTPKPASSEECSQNQILWRLIQAQERSFLPKNFPDAFDGSDVTKYRRFKLAFQQMIGEHCHDSEKFHYLMQYTEGYAHDLVSSCYSEDTSKSFLKAMVILDEKFDNSYVVAHTHLRKLRNWPDIKNDDGKALEELSMYLTSCRNMMENSEPLQQLDNHEEIKHIIDKLPFDMRKSWRSYAVNALDSNLKVGFVDLEKFVSKQCKLVNSPIFGSIMMDKSRELSVKPKHKVMATVMEKTSNGLVCKCCNKVNSHTIEKCFFFKKKSFNDKRKFIKESKLCFGCLSDDHQFKDCQNKLICGICNQQHPTCMHKTPFDETNPNESELNDNTNRSIVMSIKSSNSFSPISKQGRMLSPAVPVLVRLAGTNNTVCTYAALDSWASDCFISSELLGKLGVDGQSGNINLATMSSVGTVGAKIVSDIVVSDLKHSVDFQLPSVYCLNQWPFDKRDVLTKNDLSSFDHLRFVDFNFVNENVGLLIGASMPELIKPLETVSGTDTEPFAIKYELGWAVAGPLGVDSNKRPIVCHRIKASRIDQIENDIDRMFSSDFIDVEPEKKGSSVEDKLWLEKVSNSINVLDDGHYEIALPFRDDNVEMPCNYKQALGCFGGLRKRFQRDSGFFEDYKKFVQNMITKGYLEPVPEQEIDVAPGRRWFLVHHGVYHKIKEKIRVVFDCSKKNSGVSLNDKLLKGPDLMNNLAGVLLRFRDNNVALMADIESMFMQVKVPKHHRDFMRIFWFADNDLDGKVIQYRLTSHTFGAVCSPSIVSFALRKCAMDYVEGFSLEARGAIMNCTYVDDVMFGAKNANDAIGIMKDVRRLVASVGFNLTGIVSNSREVLSAFPPELLGKQLRDFDVSVDGLPCDRALGVRWDVNNDCFLFGVGFSGKPISRRGMLSAIGSIFDPLGFLNPVTVAARTLFQETCRRKLSWDEELPVDLKASWLRWLENLQSISSCSFHRYIIGIDSDGCDRQMHIFCDGSLKAYGAVAYLRSVDREGNVSCSFVMSKVRQTPVGSSALRTVPRIELNSAKVAILLKSYLLREMSVNFSVCFWSDSMTVLNYINNEKLRFNRYVENRVNLIRSNSDPSDWRHVPGKLNIADVLSRGSNVEELSKNAAWKFGPEFLKSEETEWPAKKIGSICDDDSEVLRDLRIAVVVSRDNDPFMQLLLSCSSWFKILYRVSVYISFTKFLRSREICRPFSSSMLSVSERIVWVYVQSVFFGDYLSLLSKGAPLPKNNPLQKLSPVLDSDGLIRVGGRLDCSAEPYAVRHPLILPGKSQIVKCMIINRHREMGHMGKNYLLSSLRCKYWIVNGGPVVSEILRNCIQCRKLNGKSQQVLMATLPADRVTGGRPAFFATGIDYFGPFMVTKGRGKSKEKRYGVVFSCLASRAVHLEMSYSLTADSFINSLRRFISRRGQVREIYSDNGTNLVGGWNDIRESLKGLDSDAIERHLSRKQIDWHFSPPHASNFNGAWEREIRTCRKILQAIINQEQRPITDEILVTFLCEAEYIMNARPLTPLSDDVSDLRALTPNHLLMISPEPEYPIGKFNSDDCYARNRWRRIQHLAETFWLRWRREYLILLNERQKWRKDVPSLKKNDLVLVKDMLLPRNMWCTGRVIEVYKSRSDDKIRSVKVKVSKLSPNGSLPEFTELIRPVSKLIYLMSG